MRRDSKPDYGRNALVYQVPYSFFRPVHTALIVHRDKREIYIAAVVNFFSCQFKPPLHRETIRFGMFPCQCHDNTDGDVSIYHRRVFATTGETKHEQGTGEEVYSFAFLHLG